MNADVNFICKIDRELYRVVDEALTTDDAIITEEQILHIEDGHPGDYEILIYSADIKRTGLYFERKPSAYCIGAKADRNSRIYGRGHFKAEGCR